MMETAAVGAFGLTQGGAGFGIGGLAGTAGGVLAGAGMAASAAGGPVGPALAIIGSAIAAIGRLASSAETAARGLADFSPQIGGALAEFDIFMMGFKMQLGQALGPEFASLIQKSMGFLADILPRIAPRLEFVLYLLGQAVTALQSYIDFMDKATGYGLVFLGAVINQIQKLPVFGSLTGLPTGAGDTLMGAGQKYLYEIEVNTRKTADLLEKGHDQNIGFLTALGAYSHGPLRGGLEAPVGGMDVAAMAPKIIGGFQQGSGFGDRNKLSLADQLSQMPPGSSLGHPTNLPGPQGYARRGTDQTSSNTPSWPMPQNAPVHLDFHNSMAIAPEHEDRLFLELQELRREAMVAISGMRDSRWARLAFARHGLFGRI